MRELLKISILGDITFDAYRDAFDRADTEEIFGQVADELRSADICVANLEAPTHKNGAPIRKCGPCLHGKPEDMMVLRNAGISVLSLANNHILDYGSEALEDTLEAAQENGISFFGAGRNTKEAAQPLFLESKGWKIGFLSFAEEEFNIAGECKAGANLFDPYISLRQIEEAKAKCDYLIVLYHGGIEHYAYPSPLLQKKGRYIVEAGADLVLCQHSHCIGTCEQYKNATILYGQGNALFGRIEGRDDWNTGLLVTLQLNETKANVSYRVLEAQQTGICFTSAHKNEIRLEQMHTQSLTLQNASELKEKWVAFCSQRLPAYIPMICCWGRVLNKLNKLTNNLFGRVFVGKKQQFVAMNIIRCDAHREVVQTILENAQR